MTDRNYRESRIHTEYRKPYRKEGVIEHKHYSRFGGPKLRHFFDVLRKAFFYGPFLIP